MDVRALHSPPWRLDIARYRRRPPQIRVRVELVIPQFRPGSLSLANYLSRHWVDSPRQPAIYSSSNDRHLMILSRRATLLNLPKNHIVTK